MMDHRRVISTEFTIALKQGTLSAILVRVKEDDTLMLALRNGYINIYYRGGNLLKIAQTDTSGVYIASFDTKYNTLDHPLPIQFPFSIEEETDAGELVNAVPELKYVMDRYFAHHRKSEREFQQLVARENNCSPISNETEYFIVDIEVAGIVPNARFDMLAVRWLRNERKTQGVLVPVLIEMKYGINSLEGSSGLKEHLQDARALQANAENWDSLRSGLEAQVNQLDNLGLLAFNRSTKVQRLEIDPTATPELVFLLANYNPASTKLSKFLAALDQTVVDGLGYELLFFVSSFAGYGMHRACMLQLEEFKALVSKLSDAASRRDN